MDSTMSVISSNATGFSLATIVNVTIILILPVTYICRRAFCSTNRKTLVTTLTEIHQLLNPTSMSIASLLQSRQQANVRLTQAFSLSNTFVSNDPALHSTFVREAKQLITAADSGYIFGRLATGTVNELSHCLLSKPSGYSIPYDQFMQIFTFKVMISTLFKVEPASLDIEDVIVVTSGINTLWTLSKSTTTFPPGLLESINIRLSSWMPECNNPLNFVIPVYETMWQVAAVGVALMSKDPQAQRSLAEYLYQPKSKQFTRWSSSGEDCTQEYCPSVQALVLEILRLYPPVRRISRVVLHPFVPSLLRPSLRHVVAADISALHRDVSIWGADADQFNAFRHQRGTATAVQKQSLLPFSVGRLKCVAAQWSPQAAGLLIAAVVGKVCEEDAGGIEILEGSAIGSREGWHGWAIARRRQL